MIEGHMRTGWGVSIPNHLKGQGLPVIGHLPEAFGGLYVNIRLHTVMAAKSYKLVMDLS